MILYAAFSNQGGMKRVVEAQLKQSSQDDVIFVHFSELPPTEVHKNQVWLPWSNTNKNYTTEKILFYKEELQKKIDLSQIKYVIGDCLTLPYFEGMAVEFIYDIHSLSLPLHSELQKDFSFLLLDKLTEFPTSNIIRLGQVSFSKHEYSWIKRSIGFISNSRNSTFYLHKYYADIIEGKPIFEVPVISFLESRAKNQGSYKYPFFTFSRWHPQKGYHLLFNHFWKDHALYVRGVNIKSFLPEGLVHLKEREIHLLPWSDNSEELAIDLVNSEIVLFPAIYEPFGLALEEAMSLGCLCVAHRNNSGHEEQILDQENGILLDFKSPNFMNALKVIYEMDEKEKNRIRCNAKNSKRATIKDREAKLTKVFEWLRERL